MLRKPIDMGWLKGYFQAMLSLRTPLKKSTVQLDIA
jgi:hypothetical protein